MINLDDIRGRAVYTLLENYSGINPYLRKLRNDYMANTKAKLTEAQIKYVSENHDRAPMFINKIVGITPYLGEELQKSNDLKFIPTKILIEYMLADGEKTYHVYGKLKQNQKESKMYFIPKTQVLDDPYFEKIEVNIDFTPYNDTLAKSGKKLYIHQEKGVEFLVPRKGAILADDMGLGKMELVTNRVFTPFGRQQIGKLKIGDSVIGSNGKAIKITGVYPQGIKELYRVTFNDGYSVLVGAEHLWSVSSNNSGENSRNRVNRFITLSTKQMLDTELELEQTGTGWNTKRLYKFKTHYKQSNGQNKWQIPIVNPIEFENTETLPIEPYFLGLALGDGHFTDLSSINFQIHKDDYDEMFENTLVIERKATSNIRRGYTSCLKKQLVMLGLNNTKSDTKFIPDVYKYASIQDRLAILQGLMDTDGHCMKSKNGEFNGTEYCSVSEQLTDDVAEIVHSLGGIVRKSSKIGSYTKNGVKVICKKAFRLNIKLPSQFNPFRLKRKANDYNPPKKYQVGRYIQNIRLERNEEAVCISVDAPDKLYVTEHAIVTHNTVTSIVAALEAGAKKILIVCPASVKINWEREINVFCNNTTIVKGTNWRQAKFTIINFDILKNFHTLNSKIKKATPENPVVINRQLVDANFDLVIIDEAHNLKDNKSIRGELMVELAVTYGIEKVWLLTGTPIANRPMDFYNLLKLIKAPIADNWQYFAKRYCDGKRITTTTANGIKRKVWLTKGATNLDELHSKTKNLMLRRLKKDAIDMPDKVVTPLYHELSKDGWEAYDALWDAYLLKRLVQKKKGTVERDLVELILLRQFIAMQAIPQTIELVEDAIEMGRKVIIFTSFNEEQEAIVEHFGKLCVAHNGSMSSASKQASVDAFQTKDKVKVFVGNIKSAGVGITLTEATVVIFNSFDWVPGSNEQAEDRAYRIGQKNDVNVYYHLFLDTITTRMWDTVNNKKDVIAVIMGENISDEEKLDQLIEKSLEDES